MDVKIILNNLGEHIPRECLMPMIETFDEIKK